MSEPRIVFHYPLPIVEGGASGGQMRPAHMLAAFRELGYQVDVVAGYSAERRSAMQIVRRNVAAGHHYAFVYAETINKPLLLAERLHLNEANFGNGAYLRSLLHHTPWQDFQFFHWLRGQNIPLGLFCRDMYWQFEFFQERMNQLREQLHRQLYLLDWRLFRQTVTHLFLPDLAMCEVLPNMWEADQVSPLPPGTAVYNNEHQSMQTDRPLNLFYVGGIVPPRYDLKNGLMQLAQTEHMTMTLCCRPSEWEIWQDYYELSNRIHIVHASGAALAEYYQAADLFFMVREPFEYWQYTIPIKIFEALGHGLPIVLLNGTPAAAFVSQHDVGWVLDSPDELSQLLDYLQQNRAELTAKRERILDIRMAHTWLHRAGTVSEKLHL